MCLCYPEQPCRNVIASEAARRGAEPKSVLGVCAGRPIAMSFVAGSRLRGDMVVGVKIRRSTASDCTMRGIENQNLDRTLVLG